MAPTLEALVISVLPRLDQRGLMLEEIREALDRKYPEKDIQKAIHHLVGKAWVILSEPRKGEVFYHRA